MEKARIAVLYEKYADTVTRAAWHYTGSIYSAQDCAQEAFLRLMQQDDLKDEHILPWLLRTAVNIAKDILKSAEHRRTVSLEDTDPPADFTGDSFNDVERAAVKAILSLDELYRIPLYFHLAEGYTIRHTARIIGKSFNTTASLIRRGKKLLREAYEKEESL